MIVYKNIQSGLSEVYLGVDSISEVYIGVNKVYPTGETPSYGNKVTIVYNDSSTYSVDCESSSSTVTHADVHGGPNYFFNIVHAEIGDCVTTIGHQAFASCPNLLSVNIPNSVTTIGTYAFQGCSGLTSVSIPDSVTTIDNNAFQGCSGLTSVSIPDSVTTIGSYGLSYCGGLTSVAIGSGVTTMGEECFQYCVSLTSVTINAVTPPALGINAFLQTPNALIIYVPSESVETYKTATNWSTYADRIQAIPSS